MRSICALVVAGLCAAACSFNPKPPAATGGGGSGTGGVGTGQGGAGGSGPTGTGGTPPPMCTGLRCRQTICIGDGCIYPPCAGGARTTLTGTVYDPAGKVPLYNVITYVPNADLAKFNDGPSCDRCDTALSGDPIVRATSDAA